MIAVLVLTVFHPGYCFPQMQMRNKHLVTDGNFTSSKIESDYDDSNTAFPRLEAEAPKRKGLGGFFRK